MARWAWRCRTPEATGPHSPTEVSTASNANGTEMKEGPGVGFGRGRPRSKKDSREPQSPAPSTAVHGRRDGAIEDARALEVDVEFEHRDGEGLRCRGGKKEIGREDTGVASLLVALGRADPSGDTIRSMQRWVIEAVTPEEADTLTGAVTAYHKIFVNGKKSNRMQWMRACREVGEVLRLVVGALDEDGPEGVSITL